MSVMHFHLSPRWTAPAQSGLMLAGILVALALLAAVELPTLHQLAAPLLLGLSLFAMGLMFRTRLSRLSASGAIAPTPLRGRPVADGGMLVRNDLMKVGADNPLGVDGGAFHAGR